MSHSITLLLTNSIFSHHSLILPPTPILSLLLTPSPTLSFYLYPSLSLSLSQHIFFYLDFSPPLLHIFALSHYLKPSLSQSLTLPFTLPVPHSFRRSLSRFYSPTLTFSDSHSHSPISHSPPFSLSHLLTLSLSLVLS